MPAPYSFIAIGEWRNGGMLDLGSELGERPPYWIAYFGVEDCEASVERAKELGGRLAMGPMDITVGSFAVLVDPQGAAFTVYQGRFDP